MSNTRSILSLVAGVAIGATLGILLAPDSGKATRRKLMKRGEHLRDELTDLIDAGEEAVTDLKDKAKSAASEMTGAAREKAEQVKSDVRQASQGNARSATSGHA